MSCSISYGSLGVDLNSLFFLQMDKVKELHFQLVTKIFHVGAYV